MTSDSNTLLSGLSCETESLSSLYSHALLILSLSSICQVNPERIVLQLESEVMRGPGFIPTGGNIFYWIFRFSHSKASDANIGIIAILV